MPRTVPVMPTEVPGNYNTSALFNSAVAGLGNFTLEVPFFWGYQGVTQSYGTSGIWYAVTLDSEYQDSEGGHSTTTNTSRYVCQVAGTYMLMGTTTFGPNATGIRGAKLFKNGSAIPGGESIMAAPSATGAGVVTFTPVVLAVNDYVELYAYQSSGASLSSLINGELQPTLVAWWLRG